MEGRLTHRDTILEQIKQHRGHADILAIPRPLIDVTGDLKSAALLSQLLYWTDRATLPGGWVYKSRAEWASELCGTGYALDRARRRLKELGLIDEAVHLVHNRPTLHLRLDVARLAELLGAVLAAEGHPDVGQAVVNQPAAVVPDSRVPSACSTASAEPADARSSEQGGARAPQPDGIEPRVAPVAGTALRQMTGLGVGLPGLPTARYGLDDPGREPLHIDRLLRRVAQRKAAQAAAVAEARMAGHAPAGRLMVDRPFLRPPEERKATNEWAAGVRTAVAAAPVRGEHNAENRKNDVATVDRPFLRPSEERNADGRENVIPTLDTTGTETTAETVAETTSKDQSPPGLLEGVRRKERKGERGEGGPARGRSSTFWVLRAGCCRGAAGCVSA